MRPFRWTPKATQAAIGLAEGLTRDDAAAQAGVSRATLFRWLTVPEFAEEVDRLTFLTGIANKAERLRLAKRVIARLGTVTEKDLLDWLKYAQGETDGIKLDLADLLASISADGNKVAGR